MRCSGGVEVGLTVRVGAAVEMGAEVEIAVGVGAGRPHPTVKDKINIVPTMVRNIFSRVILISLLDSMASLCCTVVY
jgi:hypothetical protein